MKSLNHPNILHFIGILVREGKNLVLITEYADGGTLRKTIKNVVSYYAWVSKTCELDDLYHVLIELTTFTCIIFTTTAFHAFIVAS